MVHGLLAMVSFALAQPAGDLVRDIERSIVFKGRDGGVTWFHPRGCVVPASDGQQRPTVLWTMQDITGSDHFGPVHSTTSSDLGKTWTKPEVIPGLRRIPRANGVEEGVCDVVPEYHPPTKTVLALGHNVFYKGNTFFVNQPARWPVYSVRDSDGHWSEPRKLDWDDPRGKFIYTSNCAQRITLDSGDVLTPLSFGPTAKAPRSVATARCTFDGRQLTIAEVGRELKGKVGRGFLEPSLARLDDRFYMTIRAEDGRGYVATSTDGLTWSDPVAWKWDTGETIDMSTTQQRWLVHSDGLFLVYTRKSPENAAVFRWRTPLWMARVDRDTMRLVKASERVVVPMTDDPKTPTRVANLGNFHVQMVTPEESWVTVGEVIPANYRGDVIIARIRWSRLNTLAR